jgi:hypothetical protein
VLQRGEVVVATPVEEHDRRKPPDRAADRHEDTPRSPQG